MISKQHLKMQDLLSPLKTFVDKFITLAVRFHIFTQYVALHLGQLPPGRLSGRPILNRTDAELFTPNDALRLTELKRQALEDGIEVREEVEIFANGDIYASVNIRTLGLRGRACREIEHRLCEVSGLHPDSSD